MRFSFSPGRLQPPTLNIPGEASSASLSPGPLRPREDEQRRSQATHGEPRAPPRSPALVFSSLRAH